MYLELLKKFYYLERSKLEDMWIYKQESKLRILKLRERIAQELEGSLKIGELGGRSDVADGIKEKMFFETDNADKIETRLNDLVSAEFTNIETETKDEIGRADYHATDYAEYLFQLEKVYALERIMEEEKLFPQDVFSELKSAANAGSGTTQ